MRAQRTLFHPIVPRQLSFVRSEIVEHDDLAWLEDWDEELFDVRQKALRLDAAPGQWLIAQRLQRDVGFLGPEALDETLPANQLVLALEGVEADRGASRGRGRDELAGDPGGPRVNRAPIAERSAGAMCGVASTITRSPPHLLPTQQEFGAGRNSPPGAVTELLRNFLLEKRTWRDFAPCVGKGKAGQKCHSAASLDPAIA